MIATLRSGPLVSSLLLLQSLASATTQTFVPVPQDVAVIQSKNYPEISISYKETTICETTPGVKGYSGFVTLPSVDKAYNVSIFFWYFEARNNSATAPTTIYIPGGPGQSFLDGAGGLPCLVNADSNSTSLNPWSWNNNVNMLYLDLPVQTGYSYTTTQNGSYDLLFDAFTPAAEGVTSVETNLTTVAASLSSQSPALTANTTAQIAKQTWQIAQAWFQDFPEIRTTNKEVNFWGYSYSGFFAPASVAYFQRQNEKIANATIEDKHAQPIQLGTLGINNGCIDILIQAWSYPEYAVNNTYGVKAISDDLYQVAKANLTKPDGCYDLIKQCRALVVEKDPEGNGNDDEVNAACSAASELCFFEIQGAFTNTSPLSAFDISLELPAVYPPETSASFYNQRWVQEALGVPVNFTLSGNTIPGNFFLATGDPMIRSVDDLDYLVSSGVNLALVYGDRDYRCNWLGVESVSLNITYPEAESFRAAGYAKIETNDSYVGGLVRQHGNVSFSRVFEAGHSVEAYQAETVYRIFNRATFGRDVATGEVEIGTGGNYSSVGPSSTFDVKNVLPPSPGSQCFLYQTALTCTDEQKEALLEGTAVVKDFIVVEPAGSPGGNSTSAGLSGTGTTGNGTSGGSGSSGATGTNGAFKDHGPSLSLALATCLLLSSIWLVGLA